MDSTVANRIRLARDAKGLTQQALANLVGVISISISRFERGIAIPSRQTLERLASALDVSPAWLLTGEGRGPALASDEPAPPSAA